MYEWFRDLKSPEKLREVFRGFQKSSEKALRSLQENFNGFSESLRRTPKGVQRVREGS